MCIFQRRGKEGKKSVIHAKDDEFILRANRIKSGRNVLFGDKKGRNIVSTKK